MNLLIDIGNSRTKAAVYEAGRCLATAECERPDGAWFDGLLARYAVQRAILSSTRGAADEVWQLLAARVPQAVRFTPATRVPIAIDYATPETLGRDRVAAAVGATVLYPGRDVLIVDFGTALTIDWVTADGTFRGGTISPGLTCRFSALHDYTASLPLCEPTESEVWPPRSTREAIEQGVMQSVACEIEGRMARLRAKNDDFCVIFTGGEAKYFAKRIKNTIFAEPNLVFCGLNRILEYHATTD